MSTDALASLGARPRGPERLRLRDMPTLPRDQGGWILPGERPRDEIALALVGKFWRPVIVYANVPPDAFREFREPGYAETIDSLSVRAIDDRRTALRRDAHGDDGRSRASVVQARLDAGRRVGRTRAGQRGSRRHARDGGRAQQGTTESIMKSSTCSWAASRGN